MILGLKMPILETRIFLEKGDRHFVSLNPNFMKKSEHVMIQS